MKSAEIIQKALDAAGLDELGILKGITTTAGETDITMHPKHVHRIGLGSCPVYGCPFFLWMCIMKRRSRLSWKL